MRGGAVRTICRAPNKDLSRVGQWQGKMPIGYAGWSHGWWQDIGEVSWFRVWPHFCKPSASICQQVPMSPTSCNTHQRPRFIRHCQCIIHGEQHFPAAGIIIWGIPFLESGVIKAVNMMLLGRTHGPRTSEGLRSVGSGPRLLGFVSRLFNLKLCDIAQVT